MATQWYQNHLGSRVQVLLITNDRENKRKATEEGISAETGSSSWVTCVVSVNWLTLLKSADKVTFCFS